MRVLFVLAALASTPLVAGMAQGSVPKPFGDPKMCGRHLTGVVHSSSSARVPAAQPVHGGVHGVLDFPCPSETPTPPPAAGTVRILGGVYNGTTWAALVSWPVHLIGPVSTSTVTDASGSYLFASLPPGFYTICVDVPTGWDQTMPVILASCPSGFGYQYDLKDGEESSWNNFALVQR